MRDNKVRGPIYRKAEVRPDYHEHHQEHVVVACFTFETYGLTQHTPVPLSIEAAAKTYRELGDALRATVFAGDDEDVSEGLDGKRYLTLKSIFDDLLKARDAKDIRTICRNAYKMQWFRDEMTEAGE